MIIPLPTASQAPKAAARLIPVVSIGDQPHVMVTQFMAAVPEKLLTEHFTSAVHMRDEITAAIDMLIHGF